MLGLFKSTVNPIFTSIMSRVVGADEQGMEIDKTYRHAYGQTDRHKDVKKKKRINRRTVNKTQTDVRTNGETQSEIWVD